MNSRLLPYKHSGWTVHHYIEGQEQFIAVNDSNNSDILRSGTKEGIELLIRWRQIAKLSQPTA